MKTQNAISLLTLVWTFLIPLSVLGVDPTEASIKRIEDCAIAGFWKVSFSPNRAVRTYAIAKDGSVILAETGGWKATLKTTNNPADSIYLNMRQTGLRGAEHKSTARWYLRFEEDPVGCFEVISLTEEGSLFVEHFNPTATALPLPDQIGIGHRTEEKSLEERRCVRGSTKLNSDG